MNKKMIISLALLVLFFLQGCATEIQHIKQSEMSGDSAVKIIEQVIMEQPSKFRPEFVTVTSDYVGIGSGLITKGLYYAPPSDYSDISMSTHSTRSINKRIYFNSIGAIKLFEKREWFIVQVFSKEGYKYGQVYTRSKTKAMRFIDAINHFKANAGNG